jgi:hypothetical protein
LRWLVVVSSVLAVAGCTSAWLQEFLGENPDTALVPADTVGDRQASTPPAAALASLPKVSGETAMRVDFIGRKVLTANPQAGLQPLFITIRSEQPELFHRGVTELYITEGLVKKCDTEGKLAAVLAHELGRMVAEREALAGPQARNPERRPPAAVPVGNAGQPGPADLVHEAELAKFDQENPRPTRPMPPPDPKVLARSYLKKANYAEADFEAVAPLLRAADANCSLEKQIKAAPPAVPAWNPAK